MKNTSSEIKKLSKSGLATVFRTSISGLLPEEALEPDEIELPEEMYINQPDGFPRLTLIILV